MFGSGYVPPAVTPGVVNLFATFQQNQAAILNSAGAASNFRGRLAAPVGVNNQTTGEQGSGATTAAAAAAAANYAYASSAAAASFAPQHRPSASTSLHANPAAKAKSQPRPMSMPKSLAKPKQQPQPTAAQASNSSANADYVAAILGGVTGAPAASSSSSGSGAASSSFSSFSSSSSAAAPASSSSLSIGASLPTINVASGSTKAVYAPPPRPVIPSAANPGAPAAPIGPATNVIRSATNANVSIIKSQPPQAYEGLKCDECGPNSEVIVDPHQGVEVCTTCGLVVGTWISDESEWRTFSDRRGDDPNRVGGPEIGLLADAGLATLMGDSPNGLGSTMAKLQNKNAMSANHRHLMDAFRKSSRISSLLSLPQSITDRANELYKKIIDSGLMRPRGSDTLIITCLFMVCKHDGVPRTLKEMCAVSEVTSKDLHKAFKEVKRLGFHKTLRLAQPKAAKGAGAGAGGDSDAEEDDDYKSKTARWGNQIKLAPKLVHHAKAMASKARDTLMKARDPASTCGAALYIASHFGSMADEKPLDVISLVVGISPHTIRQVVRDILESRASILPPEHMHVNLKLD